MLAASLLERIGLFLSAMNGGYRMLQLQAVVPRHEGRLDTRNQLFEQPDYRHSSTPPTAEVTGVRSRIPRSLDPPHSLPKSNPQLTVRNILRVQSRWLIQKERMLDRDQGNYLSWLRRAFRPGNGKQKCTLFQCFNVMRHAAV